MMTITEQAARQIRAAARQSGLDGMALRIAAKRQRDGAIEYAMGFDDVQDRDTRVTAHEVEIVIAGPSAELLRDVTLDYVELAPGEFRFIFLNPNDTHYVPPKRDDPS